MSYKEMSYMASKGSIHFVRSKQLKYPPLIDPLPGQRQQQKEIAMRGGFLPVVCGSKRCSPLRLPSPRDTSSCGYSQKDVLRSIPGVPSLSRLATPNSTQRIGGARTRPHLHAALTTKEYWRSSLSPRQYYISKSPSPSHDSLKPSVETFPLSSSIEEIKSIHEKMIEGSHESTTSQLLSRMEE